MVTTEFRVCHGGQLHVDASTSYGRYGEHNTGKYCKRYIAATHVCIDV